jgi:hypothetical protein
VELLYIFSPKKKKKKKKKKDGIACGDCSGMNHGTTRTKRRLSVRYAFLIVFQEKKYINLQKILRLATLKVFSGKKKQTWLVLESVGYQKKKNWVVVVVIVHPQWW